VFNFGSSQFTTLDDDKGEEDIQDEDLIIQLIIHIESTKYERYTINTISLFKHYFIIN